MKAYIVHAPHSCALCDIPVPNIAEDEVLVKVKAAAICHSDLDIIEGKRLHSINLPVVIGHEFAGEIVEIGAKVTGLQKGQNVACECIIWCGTCKTCMSGETSCCENFNELGTMRNGGFAEYTAVPARMVHPIYNLTCEEASNIEPAGNGCHAAQAAGIREGDTVAIIGPGPIGLYAMQFAALYNPSKLIMIGTRENRLAVAGQLGATHVVNINKCDPCKAVTELTHGKGVDRVMQCATTSEATRIALGIMGANSVMVIEGYGGGEPIPLDFNEFLTRPMSILGVTGVSHKHFIDSVAAAETGRINIKPLLTHRFALDNIEEAFHVMRDKSANTIKINIIP